MKGTKVRPHLYRADPDAPGTCTSCHLIKKNRAHDPAAVDQAETRVHEAQAAARARLGERED